MRLFEIFDNTYADISWNDSDSHNGNYFGTFIFNEHEYLISIIKTNYGKLGLPIPDYAVYNIQFEIIDKNSKKGSVNASNLHNSLPVLSTVTAGTLQKIITEHLDPDFIIASVSLDSKHNTEKQINQRKKIYTNILSKLKTSLHMYEIMTGVFNSGCEHAILSKVKINDDIKMYIETIAIFAVKSQVR